MDSSIIFNTSEQPTNILEFPIKDTHQEEHRKMQDNLVKILSDLNDTAKKGKISGLPLQSNGELDWDSIPVSFVIKWTFIEATRLNHDHAENSVDKH